MAAMPGVSSCVALLLALLALSPSFVQAATPGVSAGNTHSLALRSDGTVLAWGDDTYGQLGRGRVITSTRPVRVSGIDGVVAVSASYNRTLALKSDGTVWSWGGTLPLPARMEGLADVVAISSGRDTDLALTSSGSVFAIGRDRRPARLEGLPRMIAIFAGSGYFKAVAADGGIWAWGSNFWGELNDGTRTDRDVPFRTHTVDGALAATAWAVLHRDGTVWRYGGINNHGWFRATEVPPGVALYDDGYSTFVFTRTGPAWTWGLNDYDSTPVRFEAINDVSAIATGRSHYRLALKRDGTVWASGWNNEGQLGDGTLEDRDQYVPVVGLSGVVGIAAGEVHSVAVRSDGTVWAWGSNRLDLLGQGAAVSNNLPAVVAGLADVVRVAAGTGFSLALKADGTVHSWGDNGLGELGDGGATSRSTPGRIAGLPAIREIAAGSAHAMALDTEGGVWSWGLGEYGFLGREALFRSPPVRANIDSRITAISAGSTFSLALDADGTVWSWGRNFNAQLGYGHSLDLLDRPPARVIGLTDVVSIAAGHIHGAAVRRDGSVWVWGEMRDADNRLLPPDPHPLQGLPPMAAVSAGFGETMFLARDGSVWFMEDGGFMYRGALPFRVEGLSGAVEVQAGTSHRLVRRADGTVAGWGANSGGQLGDGTLASRPTPVSARREGGAGTLEGNDWFLDLDGYGTGGAPADAPPFLATVIGMGSTARADIRYRQRDVNTTGSVFVFAMAPASRVQGAASSEAIKLGFAKDARKADTPIACVLAQLNAAGQMVAVTSSNLAAYLTGVLSAQGASVGILNGVPVSNVAGATFFVGYGTSGGAMINSGTNRGAVTFPGDVTCTPSSPETGWWWNPLEDGRGFSLEVRGSNLFFASFLYDVSGRSTWYVSSGPASLDGSLYNGELLAARGGQTLGGAYRGFPTLTGAGNVTMAFNSARSGTLVWPGGTVPIQRFNIVPDGLATAPMNGQPESGWWWNEQEAGRGFFLEWQGRTLDIAGYMYDDAGNPVWYLTVGDMAADGRSFSGTWWSYGNGQTLTGPWRQHTRTNANVAPLSITFSGADSALMTLPNGRTTTLRRHRF